MSIDFSCPSCNKQYRVKDELAGKSAKCAKCDHRFKVPTPVAELAALDELAVDDLSAGNEVGSWMDDELSASMAAKPAPPKKSGGKCSACGNSMAGDAVICVACGFDTRSGKKHETKKVVDEDESASGGKALVSQSASLARGAIFSAIGAAVGAAVWVGVAIGTGYEIGWIAWGLGFAAGVGMAFGHEDDDGTTAGIVAGGVSIVGILGAKFALFQYLKSQMLDAGGAFAELGGEAEALQGALEQLFEQQVTFGAMFSPIDGLFILLAVASAYKIGSGQMVD